MPRKRKYTKKLCCTRLELKKLCCGGPELKKTVRVYSDAPVIPRPNYLPLTPIIPDRICKPTEWKTP